MDIKHRHLIVVFTVVCLVALCACTAKQTSSSNSSATLQENSNSDIQDSPILEENSDKTENFLVLVTDPYGGIFRNGATTSTGYYELMNTQDGCTNVVYTDYETCVRTYLCGNPNCSHNDNTCTSWFPVNNSATIFSTDGSEKIYLAVSGMADIDSSKGEEEQGTIYSFAQDGSNRQVLYRLKSNEQLSGAIAAGKKHLYIGVQVVDPETYNSSLELREIDLVTGESRTIYSTTNPGERLFGTSGSNLVLEEVTDTNRNYCTLDPATGEKSAPHYSYDYNAEVRIEAVDSGYVYSLRSTQESQYDLYRVSLDTGDEEKIASNIEIYDTDSTRISGFFDEHVEIETSDNRDSSNIQFLKYAVDLNTGEVRHGTLQYDMYGTMRNVFILAETDADFLVRNGVKNQTLTVVDNTGIPSQIDAALPQYALIAKSDYWNCTPNYRSVKDLF